MLRSRDRPSIFDRIDPDELVATAEAMATRGKDIHDDELQGEAIGAVLGLTSHAVEVMAPNEYAHWVTQADPEAIMQGAEHAVQEREGAAAREEIDRLAGASVGLLSGFVDQSHPVEEEMLPSDDPR